MPFPLGEWIDDHEGCRYNLAKSGMVGSIPSPSPSAAEVRRADPDVLRDAIADDLRVDARRVFLTTGGSQANALAILFLSRSGRGRSGGVARVCYPEYPPLFDTARAVKFRLTEDPGAVDLAVLSQPRNPEGDVWERGRLIDWASGARSLLVDETFREFAHTRSVLDLGRPGTWASGSFTKFYAGDPLRVGFLVAPESQRAQFATFHGLVTNLLSPYSVAGALRALHDRERTRRRVGAILERNVSSLRRMLPGVHVGQSPVAFDRPATGESGDALQQRAVRRSVLVASGSFFGDPSGVRLCLTRRTFPRDLAKYVEVRDRPSKRRSAARRG